MGVRFPPSAKKKTGCLERQPVFFQNLICRIRIVGFEAGLAVRPDSEYIFETENHCTDISVSGYFRIFIPAQRRGDSDPR